jgi:hypothetical protein
MCYQLLDPTTMIHHPTFNQHHLMRTTILPMQLLKAPTMDLRPPVLVPRMALRNLFLLSQSTARYHVQPAVPLLSPTYARSPEH